MVGSLLLLCGIYGGLNRYLRIPSANEQKAQPAQTLTFTPVVERMLTNDTMLGFDTGKVVEQLPEGWKRDGVTEGVFTAFTWMEENRMDAVYLANEGLLGAGMLIHKLRAGDWTGLSAARLESMMQSLPTDPVPAVKMRPDANGPACYGFHTREGGTGLLQLTSLADSPQGMKICYKLVQNVATNTNTSQTTVHTDDTTVAASDVPLLSYQGAFNSNATPPTPQTEPPKLRFVAWQDEWKTNQPGAARHPDGSPVTNAAELKWLRLSVRNSMNFWRRGVGWEWIFVIARSLELRALPYALNRPPRAAASFNPQAGATGRQPFRSVAFVSRWRLSPVAHPGRWPHI
jgi:hypothetical protein